MTEEGFIPLGRGFFDDPFWLEVRAYSRSEAWLDLIQLAAFRARKKIISGSLVEVPRGGIVASERFLSDRWMWSRTKVRAFLDLLRGDGRVRTTEEKTTGCTIVFLCNYERFNTVKEPPSGPAGDQGKTSEEPKEKKETREFDSLPPTGLCASRAVATAEGETLTATREEVLAFAKANHIAEQIAQTFFDDCEARPLHVNGCWLARDGVMPIAKWRNALRSYARRWVDNEQREAALRGAGRGGGQKPGARDEF